MMTRFRNIGLLILLLLAGRMAAQVPVLDSVCSGAVRNYRVDGEPGSTYSWNLTPPSGVVELLPSDADTLHMTWNYPPGIYELQAIQHPVFGCDANAVFGQVIIFEQPNVFAGPGSQICADGFYHLVNATADYTRSVLWETSGDGTFDNNTMLYATYTPGTNDVVAGVVTLTLTGFGLGDEGTCDPAVSSMEIEIDSLPAVYAGADQTIPNSTSTTIGDATASGTGSLTYSWTPAGLLLDPAVLNPTTVDLVATTVFTLTVTDSIGCENSDEVTITVAGVPLQAITGPGNHCKGDVAIVPLEVDKFISVAAFQLKLSYNVDNLLCSGYTNAHPQLAAHLTGWVDPVAGVITLQWQDITPVTFTQQETVCELVFTTKQGGQGQLEWYTGATESYFTDLAGSPIPAEFHTGQLNIYDPPVIMLPDSKTVCEGEMFTVKGIASSTHPPVSYQWIYPDGQTHTTDPYFLNVTQANAGDYTLLATDTMGCTDQKTIRLVVNENPVAAFHGSDTLTVQPGYILEAGTGMASYLWNTGDTTESITINTEGWYIVEMMSQAGCSGIDSVYILLIQACLDYPNAFTPNGDGLNDVFQAVSICPITYFRMLIFNRWGEKLFESHDISIGWDGKKNGVPCPGDTYVFTISYIIELDSGTEVKNEVAGIVVLLK
jgi:gliding motility-associated-like protein